MSSWCSEVCSSDLGEQAGRELARANMLDTIAGQRDAATSRDRPVGIGVEEQFMVSGNATDFANVRFRDFISAPLPAEFVDSKRVDVIAREGAEDGPFALFELDLLFQTDGLGDAAIGTDEHEGARRNKTGGGRSEEHTSELQSLMRISYAVFCLK